MSFRSLIILVIASAACLTTTFVSGFSVDISGEPQLECGGNAITLRLNTRNAFDGHIYVKGLFSQPGCRVDGSHESSSSISIPFHSCGIQIERSKTPGMNGLFLRTQIVISFHANFITKSDRSFALVCFYMSADKVISTDIEVNMLTPGEQTQNAPMPTCSYHILAGSEPIGKPIKYAVIGQAVYHKWSCRTETVGLFCMKVTNCFVDDGHGDRFILLDENGCAKDKHLLNNLQFLDDLTQGQASHVFKYADRPQLYFQCQVVISTKNPSEQCARPQCAEPPAIRGRRSLRNDSILFDDEFFESGFTNASRSSDVNGIWLMSKSPQFPSEATDSFSSISSSLSSEESSEEFCLDSVEFGLLIGFASALGIATIILTVLTVQSWCNRH